MTLMSVIVIVSSAPRAGTPWSVMVINNQTPHNLSIGGYQVFAGTSLNDLPKQVQPYAYVPEAPGWLIQDGNTGEVNATVVYTDDTSGSKVQVSMYNNGDAMTMTVESTGTLLSQVVQSTIPGYQSIFTLNVMSNSTKGVVLTSQAGSDKCCTLDRPLCPQAKCSVCCRSDSPKPHPSCGCGWNGSTYLPMCGCTYH